MPSPKKQIMELMVSKGKLTVMVDTRVPDVQLPASLMPLPQVALNLSYRFGTPLAFQEDAVHATLSFGAEGIFDCVIPYPAIRMASQNGEVYLFPDELLPEVARVDKVRFEAFFNSAPELSAPRTGHLKLLLN